MKIAIAGVGAMGGRYAYMISKAGYDVTMIDQWKPHVDAIRKDGFQISFNGEDVVAHIPVYFPEEVVEMGTEFDLVILFTKSMQLDGMLQAIKPIVTNKNTFTICLLNGIGHERVVEKYVPLSNMLLGNTLWTAGLIDPGKIKLQNSGVMEFCELHPNAKDMALKALEVFEKSELNPTYSTDVYGTIYKKAVLNGTMNCLCTLLEVNMCGLGDTTGFQPLANGIIDEFAAIAAADDIIFDKEEAHAGIMDAIDINSIGVHFPSMYQDLISQNRLTEIDCLNGYISERGRHHNVPTPYCDFVTNVIHSKEQIRKAE